MTGPARETLTREVVVAAARELIGDEGLDSLSLRRVAGRLGVTAPALYAYVEDKGDLLRSVAELAFAELTARFGAVSTSDDPLRRVRAYSRAYIEFAVDQPELFRTMFVFPPALGVGAPIGSELPAATRAFDLPQSAIDEGIEQGLIRPVDPLTISLTLWAVAHGAADVLLMGFDFDDAGREAIIESVLDTVVRGLQA